MFEISDDAVEFILTSLEAALEGRPDLRRRGSSVGLRLSFGQDSAHLSLAFPRPTDQVMSFMGRPLVIIDSLDFSRLDGVCLTMQQGPRGRALSMVPRTREATAQA